MDGNSFIKLSISKGSVTFLYDLEISLAFLIKERNRFLVKLLENMYFAEGNTLKTIEPSSL